MTEGRGNPWGEPGYLFGDSTAASHRLRLLAEIFVGSSRAFLSEAAPHNPDLAVDIGCGPGYTTRLVSSMLRPRQTVGMDISEVFVAEARRTARQGERYLVHDATIVPFPVGPADLVYARFVATHLRDPAAVVGAWVSQLSGGGLLLLDEVESITTTNRVLSRYIEIVDSLLHKDRLSRSKTVRARRSASAYPRNLLSEGVRHFTPFRPRGRLPDLSRRGRRHPGC